jgi:cytochrome d ubiquinol oxidase subunit I
MITAAYLTTAFFVGGMGSWYLLKKRHVPQARIMVGMSMLMAIFVTPVQIFLGDLHGLNTLQHQPLKVSAIEGIWETEKGASLVLFGWPNQVTEKTEYAITIPKLASLILTHDINGEVKGLKEWPKEERPPVVTVFWSFRIMVGMGLLMAFTGIMALWLYFRKALFTNRGFQTWCVTMTPSGFIAILAGWFVTEVGRQPYIVYGLMRTAEASSPVLGSHIFLSLIAFILIYTFIFGAGIYYIIKLIRQGPSSSLKEEESYGFHVLNIPFFQEQRRL